MTDAALLPDRLDAYLGGLPLRSQARLLRGLENARRDGAAAPADDFLLTALRRVVRAAAGSGIFFEPLAPFVVDEPGSRKHRGRICRRSLSSIWRWLTDEPLRDEFAELGEATVRAMLAGDYPRAREIGCKMRGHARPIIAQALENAAQGQRRWMQLATELQGGRVLDDLSDVANVLRLETRLTRLGDRLPARVDDLSPELAARLLRHLNYRSGDLVYPLVLIYSRLVQPAQLLHLLTTQAGTDDGGKLAGTRLSGCMDILLADIDLTIARIAAHLDRPAEFDDLLSAVRRFYSLASGMCVAVDFEDAAEWRERLSDKRRRASEIITAEVARVPGALRRALRPHGREMGRIVAPDPIDVDDAEHAVRLMTALRPYRSELAVNEVLANTMRQVEHFLEAVNAAVLQDLRTTTGRERECAQQIFEAALSLNAIVFGEEYAALLRRSGRLAEPHGWAIEDGEMVDEPEAAMAPPAR